MKHLFSYQDFNLNENEKTPIYKIGDIVISKSGEVRNTELVKVPRSRTGRTQLDAAGTTKKVGETEMEIIDVKPGSYFIDRNFQKIDFAYFLKEKDDKETARIYLAAEKGLITPEEKKETMQRAKLMFHYLSKVSGMTLIKVEEKNLSSFPFIVDQMPIASFSSWSIYYFTGSSGSHVSSYFTEDAAKEALKVLNRLKKYNFDPKARYEIKLGSDFVSYEEAKEIIKRFKPDFTEEDLKDARGAKLAHELGI